jgi:hypothetical protein
LSQGETPEPATPEEVTLGESHKVGWLDFDNASLINFPWRNRACFDCFPQHLGFEWIELVVISRHRKLSDNAREAARTLPSRLESTRFKAGFRLRVRRPFR